MKALSFLLVGALSACGAATPPDRHVAVRTVGSTTSASYRTFGIGLAREPAPPFQLSARAFELEERMRPLVVAELLRKGYAEEAEGAKPDLLLKFMAGYDTTPPAPQREPGGNKSGMRGEIVVDAFDGTTEAQVWRGIAQSEVDPDKIDPQLLQYAVEHLLATFPGRPAVTSP
jgi:hypothetical protein